MIGLELGFGSDLGEVKKIPECKWKHFMGWVLDRVDLGGEGGRSDWTERLKGPYLVHTYAYIKININI